MSHSPSFPQVKSSVGMDSKGGQPKVTAADLTSTTNRGKLLSCSTDSRASDSGISAEFSEYPTSSISGQNGTNGVTEDVDYVESDHIDSLGPQSSSIAELELVEQPARDKGVTNGAHILHNYAQLPGGVNTPPTIINYDVDSPSTSPQLTPCDSGDMRGLTVPAPPSSLITDNLSRGVSELSSAELSPLSPGGSASKDVIAHILDRLINEHIRKDSKWNPSGHYNANPNKNLVQRSEERATHVLSVAASTLEKIYTNFNVNMEEDIGNVLVKRRKAREDARRVLELFLEDSLKIDPDFRPSGRYQTKQPKPRSTPSPFAPKTKTPPASPSEGPSVPVPMRVPSPASVPRPLSPIIAVGSAAERGSDLSALHHQRDSYYCALYDNSADECLDNVTDALKEHVAVATPESLEENGSISPIYLIALDEGTTLSTHGRKDYERTEVETTRDGVHIHRHTEVERPISFLSDSSSTGLNPELANRKKKSFFTRTTERVRHALNRLQRSGSRSENEEERFHVAPRHKKIKKKKKRKLGSKKRNADVVDVKILQTHQHKFKIHGNAQLSGNGAGLNADIWGEGTEGDSFNRGVVSKAKASTLPTQKGSYDKSDKVKEKQRQKEREKRDKEMKELLKEARNRSNRKPHRSESSKSNDSLLRFFSIKKPAKADSPNARSDRKSFGLGSLMRKSKRKDSGDASLGNESPRLPVHSSRDDTSSQRTNQTGSERPRIQGLVDSHSLEVPDAAPQQRSKSAEEIQSPRDVAQSAVDGGRPSLRLVPQHSRSRSAQDTTTTFDAPTPSSQPPSSSPGYHLTTSKSLSPQKHYVPRSIPKPTDVGSSRSLHPRRHTTEARPPPSPMSYRRSAARSPVDGEISQYGGGLCAAGVVNTRPRNRETLNLPLNVDATVGRTQSLLTRKTGEKVLKTVTSVDGLVSMGNMDSDSEIERITLIPQADRSQQQKDKMYRHIASKLSKLVRAWESDNEPMSSNYNTPLDESMSGLHLGNSAKSSSLERNPSFVSAKSSSSTSSHGHRETIELSASAPGQVISGLYKMENIPEADGANTEPESITEYAVTSTHVSALGALLRSKGDDIHAYNPNLSAMFGQTIMQNLGTYEVFEQIVDNTSSNDSYPQRISAVFSVTKKLWKLAGITGNLANQVKENALNYIENHIAQYIMSHGGWDSMLEESSSELEVD